jgi:hypothetical protein
MLGKHLLRAEEGALQVDLEDQVPIGRLHADGQAVARDAGVVHQHVDAGFRGQHLGEPFFDGFRRRHVQVQGHRLAAAGANFLGHSLIVFDFRRRHHDIETGAAQSQCNRPADATARAGNECNTIEHSISSGCSGIKFNHN